MRGPRYRRSRSGEAEIQAPGGWGAAREAARAVQSGDEDARREQAAVAWGSERCSMLMCMQRNEQMTGIHASVDLTCCVLCAVCAAGWPASQAAWAAKSRAGLTRLADTSGSQVRASTGARERAADVESVGSTYCISDRESSPSSGSEDCPWHLGLISSLHLAGQAPPQYQLQHMSAPAPFLLAAMLIACKVGRMTVAVVYACGRRASRVEMEKARSSCSGRGRQIPPAKARRSHFTWEKLIHTL